MRFPASAGPWLNVRFDNERAAARFAKGVRKVAGYRAEIADDNPRVVITNIERWEVTPLLIRLKFSSRSSPLTIERRN